MKDDPQARLLDTMGDDLISDWVQAGEQPVKQGLPYPVPVLELPDDEPMECVVNGLLLRGDVGLIAGDGGVGKTSVSLHMATAIACGRPAFGKFETTGGTVLYISAEDGQGRIRNRVRAIKMGHLWPAEDVNRLQVLARCGVDLDVEDWRDHLRSLVIELEPVAIFLDPLRDLTLGELNSDKDVAPLIRFCRELAELPSRPAVVLVHHAGKVREGQRQLDRIRGSSALNQAPRSILFLRRRELGIEIRQIKFTDAPPLGPFLVEQRITEHEEYRGLWQTAVFTYRPLHEAERHEARRKIVATLRETPRLGSRELRETIKDQYPDISPADVSRAQKELVAAQVITFEPGPHGAKNWAVTGSTDVLGPNGASLSTHGGVF